MPTTLASRRTPFVKRAGVLLTTTATAALAIGLVGWGSSFLSARAVSVDDGQIAEPVPVQTQTLQIVDGYEVARAFTGQVEALRQTDIAFEQPGSLLSVLVDEGDRVAEGQILAQLDTRSLMAQRDAQAAAKQALEAQAELARLTTERQGALAERGFSATQTFDQARLSLAALQAQIAQTDAAIAGIDISLDKAVIRAPFAGRIGARMADEGAMVGAGATVVTLLEDGAPQMRVGLPPALAADLRPGDRLEVRIGDRQIDGVLESLRPDLDPTTRTQMAILTLETTDAIYGQTGVVSLQQNIAAQGAWMPLAALQEGTRGLWTVLTIQPDETVGLEAVEVLYADAERAFVRGTFRDGTRIIDRGPHRVIPGQLVALIAE